MLEILKETLRNTELNAWASCEACSFLEELISRDAPKILNSLENAGMLPPTINNDPRCETYFNINEWEKEYEEV